SWSGSTEKETSSISRLSSFIRPCKRTIFEVIGKQAVVQFVKMKSAIHHLPAKSLRLKPSPSCVVKSKSATFSFIFVSIGNLDEHACNKNMNVNKLHKIVLFFILKAHLILKD